METKNGYESDPESATGDQKEGPENINISQKEEYDQEIVFDRVPEWFKLHRVEIATENTERWDHQLRTFDQYSAELRFIQERLDRAIAEQREKEFQENHEAPVWFMNFMEQERELTNAKLANQKYEIENGLSDLYKNLEKTFKRGSDERGKFSERKDSPKEKKGNNKARNNPGLTTIIQEGGLLNFSERESSGDESISSIYSEGSKPDGEYRDKFKNGQKPKHGYARGSLRGDRHTEDRRQEIIYVREAPVDNDFKLNKLSVNSAVALLEHIQESAKNNRVQPPVSSYLSANVTEELIANVQERGRNLGNLPWSGLQGVSDKSVLKMIQHTITKKYLRSPDQFIKHLREVKFPELKDGYEPLPQNFSYMYAALTKYRLRFKTRFDFMSGVCDPEIIPALMSKGSDADSLVKIFLDRIPFGLGRRIQKKISHKTMHECRRDT